MRAKWVTVALLGAASVAGGASAMEFRIQYDQPMGINVLFGDGEIVDGDAQRLLEVLPKAGRDEFGNIPLYLDSHGGSVKAAFEVAKIIKAHEFSVLVPSNSVCASACATILYLTGRFHQLLGNGLLGVHTCYSAKDKSKPEPSALCNEYILQYAVKQGTSYGALSGYMERYSPYEMAWIGKDVACEFGLCGPPGFDDTLAVPSYDCAKASNRVEKAICSNKRLARHEASLSNLYVKIFRSTQKNKKRRVRQSQRDWLKERDRCSGNNMERCLIDAMWERRKALWKIESAISQ